MSGTDNEAPIGSHPYKEEIAQRIADAASEELPDRVRQGTKVRSGVFDEGRSIKARVVDKADPHGKPLAAIRVPWEKAEEAVDETAAYLARPSHHDLSLS